MNKILKNACSAFAIGCATCIGFGVATFSYEACGMHTDISLQPIRNIPNEQIQWFINLGMPGLPPDEGLEKPLGEDQKKLLYGMMFLYSYLLEENEEIQKKIHYLLSGGSIDVSIKKCINEWYNRSLNKLIDAMKENEHAFFVTQEEKIIGIIYIDGDAEIDIFVHAQAKKGVGVAVEAVKLFLKSYFDSKGAETATLSVHPNNIAMLKTLVKFKESYSELYNIILTQDVNKEQCPVEILFDNGGKGSSFKYGPFTVHYDPNVTKNNEQSYLGYHYGRNRENYPRYIIAEISKKQVQE